MVSLPFDVLLLLQALAVPMLPASSQATKGLSMVHASLCPSPCFGITLAVYFIHVEIDVGRAEP